MAREVFDPAGRWFFRQLRVLQVPAGVLCPWRQANCAYPSNPRYVCRPLLEIPTALGAPARSRRLNQSVFAKE
jgi:hypothetical protein